MLVAAVTVVVILSVLPISASAHPPTPVGGVWEYLPYFKVKNDAGEVVYLSLRKLIDFLPSVSTTSEKPR
jgi:hypothetical protein